MKRKYCLMDHGLNPCQNGQWVSMGKSKGLLMVYDQLIIKTDVTGIESAASDGRLFFDL